MLIDNYGTNRVRKVKIYKKISLKIASFAIDKWLDLCEYIPASDIPKTLKILNRQYIQYNKILVMQKNNLINLLDSCFPNVNTLFTSPRRECDGHEKWVDFVLKFPHINSISMLPLSAFKKKYQSWCRKNNYNYSDKKAAVIHSYCKIQVSVLSMTDSIIKVITEAAVMLNSTLEKLCTFRDEMDRLSSMFPEYKAVMDIYGVGKVLFSCSNGRY